MTPWLSVVVPTYQRAGPLRRLLEACTQQTLPASDFEVIVSHDGDAPEAAGLGAQGYPFNVRLVCGPHGGPSAARNRGAALARGAVVLFLDDDIVPAPACLAHHLCLHERGEGRVGLGLVRLAGGPRTPWEHYLTRRYHEHFAKLAQPGYVPTFWDCLSGSLSLPASLLRRSGGFDEGFTRHEDVEFGYRLAQLGARFVYAPGAIGEHCFHRSVEAGLRDALGEGHSAAHLSRRYPALRPQLLQARWRRYGPAGRAFMRFALADSARHGFLARRLGRLVQRVEDTRLPTASRTPLFRAATHLHFWLGVRSVDAGLLRMKAEG